MINQLNQKGQGLLEMVFAIGILVIVATSILALAISNVTGQQESEVQIIANNLSREAIEVVRSARDSNWLAGNTWDIGLVSGTAIVIFDPLTNSWQIDFDFSDQDTNIYLTNLGVYTNLPAGNLTVYRRLVEIYNICLVESGGNQGQEIIGELEQDCSPDQQKVGLKVIAKVFWNQKGRDRQIQLQDLLYAWK